MSRGHGRWERELVSATSSICVVPVGGLVKAIVPEPSRSDFTSARRAAKTLATKSQVTAFYCWSCRRCGRVQDTDAPVRCCGAVRSSLAVARPGRMLPRLAPAPTGQPPAWVGLNVASAAPAGLAAPTVDDLARLASRRLWEALDAGTLAVTPRDAVALLRLAREAGRDSAPDPRWSASMRELLWVARRHLGSNWEAFAADVRANQHLAAMWGPPPQRRAGDGTSR